MATVAEFLTNIQLEMRRLGTSQSSRLVVFRSSLFLIRLAKFEIAFDLKTQRLVLCGFSRFLINAVVLIVFTVGLFSSQAHSLVRLEVERLLDSACRLVIMGFSLVDGFSENLCHWSVWFHLLAHN